MGKEDAKPVNNHKLNNLEIPPLRKNFIFCSNDRNVRFSQNYKMMFEGGNQTFNSFAATQTRTFVLFPSLKPNIQQNSSPMKMKIKMTPNPIKSTP